MATIAETLALAVQHHEAGDLAQAEKLYRAVLRADPGEPNALHLLGVLAYQAGKHEEALALMRRALLIIPLAHLVHYHLAAVYVALGRWEEAVECYEETLRHGPDFPEARNNLGKALKHVGRLAEAEANYRAALLLQPDDADALTNLGAVLAEQGRFKEALASYRQALVLRPDFPEAYNNLGNALKELGRFAEAEASFREALHLRPDLAETYHNLGVALTAQGKHDEALACVEQALRIQPDNAQALNSLASAYKDQGRMDEALACYRKAIAVDPEFRSIASNLLLALHYHAEYNPETTFAEHLRWASQFGVSLAPHRPLHPINRDPGRRLRVGYVSGDFRQHVMGRYSEAIFGAHDRGLVEVFCYANVLIPDALTERFKASTDHWRSILGLSDDQCAGLIRQDQIDLLVDLAGHTSGNRLGVFARKPAPIQVTHCGYPASTGLASIDYRLTDASCDPPGRTERWHSEKLARLPEWHFCFAPPSGPAVSPLPARRAGEVTFGSFNILAKVTEEMIGLWSQILKGLPGSRMIVKTGVGSGGDERVRAAFDKQGIGIERVTLVGRHPDYYPLYHDVDICLDTYPYTGCNITGDALWMGVPVVSLAGPSCVTRLGVAALVQVGLGDLVTETPAAYAEAATRLAQDLPRLHELRAELRKRVEGSVGDVPRFTRRLEAAYRDMWEQFCREDP